MIFIKILKMKLNNYYGQFYKTFTHVKKFDIECV